MTDGLAGQLGPRDVDHLRWLERLGLGSLAGKAVLDLGCGGGFVARELAQRGATPVYGVDIEPAHESNLAATWRFLVSDLDDPAWGAKLRAEGAPTFDLICCFDIIEHLQSPVRFLAACHELLGPGGRLVLTTPNTACWERWVRGERWSGATDPQHRILFSRYALRFLLERMRFRIAELVAPVRTLERRGVPHPQVGAQIFCVATAT